MSARGSEALNEPEQAEMIELFGERFVRVMSGYHEPGVTRRQRRATDRAVRRRLSKGRA